VITINTLELIIYWGKLQPSNQKRIVKSKITNRRYNMSLTGFLYYVKKEEIYGEWTMDEI